MPKKKGGLSRKELQELTRLMKLSWGAERTGSPSGVLASILRKRLKEAKLVVPAHSNLVSRSIAESMVKTSTREVMMELGIIPREVATNPEEIITPEVINSVGHLVSTRAVYTAGDYVAADSPGGGRFGAGGILEAIGRSGVDVEISPSGEVSATVTPKEKPKKKKHKSAVVHFHFNINIDANIIQQMNVNPQEVKTYMESQTTTLKEIIEKKLSEIKAEDDDEDDV